MKSITRLTLGVCLAAVALAQSIFAQPTAQGAAARAADDFQITDASGKPVKLSDYRGKVVIMQFLYTTCVHCQATARMLSRLERDLAPRGLQVMGVAFNPEAPQPGVIDEFVKNNAVDFPLGPVPVESALRYLGLSVMERFVVPQIVVVDRRGMIRAQSKATGSPELADEASLRLLLDGLLKEGSSKSPVKTSMRSRR